VVARRTFDTPHFRGIEFIEVEAKSILNSVPSSYLPFNWTINPYRGCTHACVYCFARVTHTYMDMDAGRDFESKIVVKVNAPQLLRKELRSRRWKGEPVAMGTATDPYQRAEGRYRLMPRIIEALTEVRNPFSILTKGTLILRDLDLLATAARVMDVSTAFSIGTLDGGVWERSEPGTPHPKRRMEAVARLNAAGVACGVMVAPILPGLSDSEGQLRAVVEAALEARATHVTPILLHLRPHVRDVYMGWLTRDYPQLVAGYEEMYQSAYAPKAEQKQVAARVRSFVDSAGGVENHRLPRNIERSSEKGKHGAGIRGDRPAPPSAEQLRLI
jgi:DNA repair photolyase